MSKNDEKRAIRCSFCGKHQDQVAKIIAGPGAYICNECVHLCMDILENMTPPEGQMIDPDMPDTIPTPREIKAYPGRICHRTGYGEGRPVRGGVQPL